MDVLLLQVRPLKKTRVQLLGRNMMAKWEFFQRVVKHHFLSKYISGMEEGEHFW